MPKAITTSLVNSRTVAGKRGRKPAFNHHDFVYPDGVTELDITEEMISGIPDDADFDSDDLFSDENSAANKYRSSRWGTVKRTLIKANGEGKYELICGEDEDGNSVLVAAKL